jgi:hypothetical protein
MDISNIASYYRLKKKFLIKEILKIKVAKWGPPKKNCSKFDCSTINWSTLLAGNQLLDTKFINCSNPVNPGSTGFERLTKKMTTGRHRPAVDTSF